MKFLTRLQNKISEITSDKSSASSSTLSQSSASPSGRRDAGTALQQLLAPTSSAESKPQQPVVQTLPPRLPSSALLKSHPLSQNKVDFKEVAHLQVNENSRRAWSKEEVFLQPQKLDVDELHQVSQYYNQKFGIDLRVSCKDGKWLRASQNAVYEKETKAYSGESQADNYWHYYHDRELMDAVSHPKLSDELLEELSSYRKDKAGLLNAIEKNPDLKQIFEDLMPFSRQSRRKKADLQGMPTKHLLEWMQHLQKEVVKTGKPIVILHPATEGGLRFRPMPQPELKGNSHTVSAMLTPKGDVIKFLHYTHSADKELESECQGLYSADWSPFVHCTENKKVDLSKMRIMELQYQQLADDAIGNEAQMTITGCGPNTVIHAKEYLKDDARALMDNALLIQGKVKSKRSRFADDKQSQSLDYRFFLAAPQTLRYLQSASHVKIMKAMVSSLEPHVSVECNGKTMRVTTLEGMRQQGLTLMTPDHQKLDEKGLNAFRQEWIKIYEHAAISGKAASMMIETDFKASSQSTSPKIKQSIYLAQAADRLKKKINPDFAAKASLEKQALQRKALRAARMYDE